MKKKSLLWINTLLLMLAGCVSDEEIANDIKGEHGGIVYHGDPHQDIDESDPLSVFFGEELHNPYWDGSGNEYKTFFEQGEWNDLYGNKGVAYCGFQHVYTRYWQNLG